MSFHNTIWEKNVAGNAIFEYGGRISQSNGCAWDIMKYSVLQTPAPMNVSLSNILPEN